MARLDREHSGVVSDEGDRVRARRERIGWDVVRLAAESGVHRTTVAAIEDGKGFRRSSLTKIERALEHGEAETGLDVAVESPGGPHDSDLIEFDVSGDFGVHVIVKGPIRDADLLRRQVAELVREIRGAKGDTESSEDNTH